MLIRIDPGSDVALFAQVAASLRGEMAQGRLRPGDRLPAAREVGTSLGVNLHTVLRAYQDLRDEGLVDMRRGRGAVVTPRAAALSDLRAEILALGDRARALGMTADTLASLVRDSLSDGQPGTGWPEGPREQV
ncbi:GntR family transcriptional regulator [Isoptericola sp. b441]|uniref:GntR family transcriptional regulator n=1 Tax=Actinotalea lenta TaxID=3064654 RepID=A0ABT9D8K2_9CELL|nr:MULTISPECIES: GntR family transcriptional regulator [unclassified Isoptericola]MDO8106776.1 GntR family transcriptional regulator [Isoptericola sp. b441]MDO8121512.1 GntR family transcriptional regulator [Isoptericola sp. b490]